MPDKIGFFDLLPTRDERGYIGALLVTDQLGKPEEFRVTYPVKPNVVQRQLYGASLEPHVGVDLCGVPLFGELKSRGDIRIIVLVNDQFLGLASHVPSGVAKLERAGEKVSIADRPDGRSSLIRSVNPAFAPVSALYPPDYDEEAVSGTQTLIQQFFTSIDLLEPFDRIANAIAALADSDTRFQ